MAVSITFDIFKVGEKWLIRESYGSDMANFPIHRITGQQLFQCVFDKLDACELEVSKIFDLTRLWTQ